MAFHYLRCLLLFMNTFQFFIDNIQCEDCLETIKRELRRMDGVESIEICPKKSELFISGNGIKLEEIEKQLISLGYPKKIDEISLNSSCVIKRLKAWAAEQLNLNKN